MALPQRRDPEERQREIEQDLERRRLEAETAGGGWLAWWWLWLLIIIAIIWFGGWGWGGYGGWWGWGGPRGTAVQRGVLPSGTNTAPLLNATDKQAFIGQNVTLNNVQIQSKVNDHVLWIGGDNNTEPVLAVLTGAGNTTANANVNQGDWVKVFGTVEKAPPAAQTKQNWSLDDNGAKRLEQQGVYLQAMQVQKTQGGQGANAAGGR